MAYLGEEDLDEGAEFEDKTTLAYKMEHPEEAPGFQAARSDDEETPEEIAAREKVEADAAAAAAGDAETPEQKAAREAAEAEADKTKDWTVEDFRRGYKEAETRMHTATGETAKEKAAREAAEARAEAAEAKLAEQEAEKEKLATEAAKPKPLTEDEQDAIFEKAAAELADLDQTSPDYLKEYGRIWRKAINAAGQDRTPPDAETAAEEVATKAWEKFEAKRAAETAKTAEQRQREETERIQTQANDYAKKAGLDMTPGSAAYRLFWDIANNDLKDQEFMKGENPPSLEEQFKWVTEETRKVAGQVVQQTDEERRRAELVQRNNSVLGKGVTHAPSKEPPKKRSLDEMYEQRANLGERL